MPVTTASPPLADPAAPRGRLPRLPRVPGGRRGALLTGATVLVVVVLVAVVLVVTRGNGWRTVWSDDFDGAKGAPPSGRDWIVDTGTAYPGGAPAWGTGEVETYTADPSNVSQDGRGHLRITPTRDPSGAWRSGRIETRRDDLQPPAGGRLKVEARLRLPDGGQGYWAAFWMLGAPFRPAHTDWPGSGEIDVMEHLGSEPGTVHGTLHCGVWGGGPCHETTGLGGPGRVPSDPAAFHTYAVEWDRSTPVEEIRWMVDDQVFHTVRATDVDPATWRQATGHGFFVLLNVAVGGGWPGPPGATTRPGASMLVDRVTVSEQR